MLLLRICKRCEAFFNAHQVRAGSIHAMAVSKENDEILKKLGFDQRDYKRVLPKKRTTRELNLPRVLAKLTELGYTHEEIRNQPNILWLHPYSIDHRFKLLEESGIERTKITLARISKYARLVTGVIKDLKKAELIGQETDVVHNILSYSDLPLELYPPETSDDERLMKAQTDALQTYIAWLFNLSKEDVEKRYQSYEDLHHKSIRLVMQSYDVLMTRLEMPEYKIKQNIYLLEGHPENFIEILEKLPMIGDSKIQYVATTNPKILMRPFYKMMEVYRILKAYKISDESIAWHSNVLTLSPDTVRERVEALHADPVFTPFFCSPRICAVISRYHISMSRYKLLSDLKWRCLTIQILTAFQQGFERQIELGLDKTQGSDVVHYIKRHLGYENKEIKKQLKRHPFDFLMSAKGVADTLQLLLKNGFDKSDIFAALPIVLYPREKVARWLRQVHSQPEVQPLRDVEGRLAPGLTLQLVLYYMERPHHFSGSGVWSEQDDFPSAK